MLQHFFQVLLIVLGSKTNPSVDSWNRNLIPERMAPPPAIRGELAQHEDRDLHAEAMCQHSAVRLRSAAAVAARQQLAPRVLLI